MEQKTRVRVFSGHNSSQKLSFRLSAAIEEAGQSPNVKDRLQGRTLEE
jgi:hypothetical protein